MEPLPATGNIFLDPLFTDRDNLVFTYLDNSPCIDAGNPSDSDPDNSITDIGSNYFDQSGSGDCNFDYDLNILDIVYITNFCILGSEDTCACADINGDSEINILDVVVLVNIILGN